MAHPTGTPPRPLLAPDDPRAGTVGPVIGTVVVISILLLGAWIALDGIVSRVHSRRSALQVASSTLPANVQPQSVTVE